MRPSRLTAVVDIGASPLDGGDPLYKSMLRNGLCTVTGFEPQADALQQLLTSKSTAETYLPYAVGDGGSHTLHLCHAPGLASLLEPDPDGLRLFSKFPEFGRVVGTETVQTRRLDDIDEVGPCDLLKMDVQGAELSVLQNGRRKLANCVAMQIEVSFVPIYKNQPPFWQIDKYLRDEGFIPHTFAEIAVRAIAPFIVDGDPFKPVRQLLEADIVYVRDFRYPDGMTAEQWKHLALIAHHCYGSPDLALHALRSLVALGELPQEAPHQFFDMCQRAARGMKLTMGPPPPEPTRPSKASVRP